MAFILRPDGRGLLRGCELWLLDPNTTEFQQNLYHSRPVERVLPGGSCLKENRSHSRCAGRSGIQHG